jgi:hypothetical protein
LEGGKKMHKELKEKLIADEHFIIFCNLVNLLRNYGYRAGIPLDTAIMLYDTGGDFLKGEENLDVVHSAVVEFLDSGNVSLTVDFYDYIVLVLGSV